MRAIQAQEPPHTWLRCIQGSILPLALIALPRCRLASCTKTKTLSSRKVLGTPRLYEGMCKSESPCHHEGGKCVTPSLQDVSGTSKTPCPSEGSKSQIGVGPNHATTKPLSVRKVLSTPRLYEGMCESESPCLDEGRECANPSLYDGEGTTMISCHIGGWSCKTLSLRKVFDTPRLYEGMCKLETPCHNEGS